MRRWCPQCQQATDNAPLPEMASEEERLRPLRCGTSLAYCRRLYCLACGHVWTGLELPEQVVESLLARDGELERLRRELAMARLLLSKNQKTLDKPAGDAGPKLRVHHAA